MIIHDVSLLGLHVVLAVGPGRLVGGDGETHHASSTWLTCAQCRA
jgi:deoxyxylulose-5-phosphate synthase